MKYIKSYIIFMILLIIASCNKNEKDLLDSKVYFNDDEVTIEVEDINIYDYDIVSRISNLSDKEVNIEYEIGTKTMVDAYNEKYGTKHMYLPAEMVNLDSDKATIKAGNIYSTPCKLMLKELNTLEEGNSFLVPIIIKNSDLPLIDSSKILFVLVKKPIIIKKVYDFNGNYLSIPMPSTANFNSVTYEALIYGEHFTWISTILGREGVLMFRFGDTTIDADQIQIAGNIQFNAGLNFETKKWYHVAFVFDGNTKKAEIYINGEKAADKTVDVTNIDLTRDFFIGYAYDYDASRIWRGKMSECRVWNVARTSTQIRANMLGVDPKSEGLFGYWKLNGDDFYEKEGIYYVKDQTENKIDAVSRRGRFYGGSGNSVKPSVVNLKVDLK